MTLKDLLTVPSTVLVAGHQTVGWLYCPDLIFRDSRRDSKQRQHSKRLMALLSYCPIVPRDSETSKR